VPRKAQFIIPDITVKFYPRGIMYEFMRKCLGIKDVVPLDIRFGLDLVIKDEDSIGAKE
jgi:hypothetical protein